MSDSIKLRKIGSLLFLILATLLFTINIIDIIIEKISLPSIWTIENEGKFIAFGLRIWAFVFFIIPIIISLVFAAYIIHPSRFERYSIMARLLSLIFSVIGFSSTVILISMAIINMFEYLLSSSLIPQLFLMTSPFWTMGIFSLFAFKKDKFEKLKNYYKIIIFMALIIVVIWAIYCNILYFMIRPLLG